ncbi:2-hydroxychromene-2-carboxylate isomerase [Quisquiliibacterium transsilvanicum]|uniref:2-hydroxychromene-2-carboxylate isomerase n=1 Tax=Quisquiliibacterium transsilvanicum TaxID=1549638 RepID=A0A7W8HJT9_9BURK|nr:2-hydroxychromene-2-carboxylate isomerase [Quisquiliibacterium transsilvanicum]MBB5273258.1 2-hydroxychromene-2-carboxylate isomerase [Quisquiliibacterium transsilvanicum]
MKPVKVEFLFDFGSPNAYLCHQVIPAIEARTGVKFEYVPTLLGGLFKLANNRSPGEAYAAIPNKLAYERLEMRRFIDKNRLDRFRFNPFFPVNTLKIMRGACAAQKLGCFERYVDAVYAAMWEHEKNMAEDDVIVATLAAAGLDGPALMATAQEPDVKQLLLANTESAHVRGAFGSPTFFVNGEMWFGKERLGDVEEEIGRAIAG